MKICALKEKSLKLIERLEKILQKWKKEKNKTKKIEYIEIDGYLSPNLILPFQKKYIYLDLEEKSNEIGSWNE